MNRVLKLAGREGIFACGDVLEGVVAIGMHIDWPVHDDALPTTVPVSSVDYLDLDRAVGRVEVALGIRFDEDAADPVQNIEELFEPGMAVDPRRHESDDR